MPVTPPPRKKPAAVPVSEPKKASEKEIEAIIGRGGSSVSKDSSTEAQAPTIKNFNVRILSTTLDDVNRLRKKRPKRALSPKLGISLQDWMMEAIEEKINRDKKG